MKIRLASICVLFTILIISSVLCATNKLSATPSKPAANEAQELLDNLSFTVPDTAAPNKSCGIYIYTELPFEYLQVSAVGILRDTNEAIDLMANRQLENDAWLIFENLQDYSSAMATFQYVCEETVLAERTINLLAG